MVIVEVCFSRRKGLSPKKSHILWSSAVTPRFGVRYQVMGFFNRSGLR